MKLSDISTIESSKDVLLKFMNFEPLTLEELQEVLDIGCVIDCSEPYRFDDIWSLVARNSSSLPPEFLEYVYVPRATYKDDNIYISKGEVIDWKDFNTYESTMLKEVEHVGGEGEGEYAHIVIEHLPSGQFLKITGDYYSYDGFKWEYGSWYKVEKKQVTTTAYL